jgi:type IV secretory pathway VirJ component
VARITGRRESIRSGWSASQWLRARAINRLPILRLVSVVESMHRLSTTSAKPVIKSGLTLTPVNGNWAGLALAEAPVVGGMAGGLAEALAAEALAAEALVAEALTDDASGGVVGGGALAAATEPKTGGTAVVVVVDVAGEAAVPAVVVVVVVAEDDVQSAMVCCHPRFATHGGPTYASAWITPQKFFG